MKTHFFVGNSRQEDVKVNHRLPISLQISSNSIHTEVFLSSVYNSIPKICVHSKEGSILADFI